MGVLSSFIYIPNKEGIKVVETALKRKNLQTEVIVSFLKLISTLNNFVLNCAKFVQIKQCAMGTNRAPTYAEVVKNVFEETQFIR